MCLLPSNSDGVPGKVSNPFRTTAPPTVKSFKVQQGSFLDKSDPKQVRSWRPVLIETHTICSTETFIKSDLVTATGDSYYCVTLTRGFLCELLKSCTPCSRSVTSLHLSNDLCFFILTLKKRSSLHWHVVLVLLLCDCLGLVPNVGVRIKI